MLEYAEYWDFALWYNGLKVQHCFTVGWVQFLAWELPGSLGVPRIPPPPRERESNLPSPSLWQLTLHPKP